MYADRSHGWWHALMLAAESSSSRARSATLPEQHRFARGREADLSGGCGPRAGSWTVKWVAVGGRAALVEWGWQWAERWREEEGVWIAMEDSRLSRASTGGGGHAAGWTEEEGKEQKSGRFSCWLGQHREWMENYPDTRLQSQSQLRRGQQETK
ncbi:hypothetical protein OF83DRAFT_1088366 [Amylostereum chailletii]|nr:hypothetical protein OF83DRAFT_1088366 [Amylostereum chailletii]